MTRLVRTHPVAAAVMPVAVLSLLGLLTAALGLSRATFVLGAATPALAVIAPAMIARSQAMLGSRGLSRVIAIAVMTVAINCALEAAASAAQVSLLF